MERKQKSPIPFRFRPGLDDDIEEALKNASKILDRSHIIRIALREYLFKNPNNQISQTIDTAQKEKILPKQDEKEGTILKWNFPK